MQEPDVESLARIASGGDLAALNILLVTVRPEVLRLCTRMVSNRADAEEACQDTLLAMARAFPGSRAVPRSGRGSRIHKARLQLRKGLGYDGDAGPVAAVSRRPSDRSAG